MFSPPIAAPIDLLHVGDVEAEARRGRAVDRRRRGSARLSSRSASADVTPGTLLTARSIACVARSIAARSGPETLMPDRALDAGGEHVDPVADRRHPDVGEARHLHRAVELLDELRPCVMPGRHSSRGLNWIVVSIISIGAGSVAVSARPTLPNTLATSGTVLISRSVCCSSSPALPADKPGSAVGM